MRRTVIALVVGGALVLPAGAALAGDQTPGGNAWGNCKHSSGGGNPHDAYDDGRDPANPGNGGFGGPGDRSGCAATDDAGTVSDPGGGKGGSKGDGDTDGSGEGPAT